MFEGFSQKTITFFMDIRFHNNKQFMDENRERYFTDVRAPFYALIDALAPHMLKIDEAFEIRPHKCLSRINRDIRFSHNKAPYRDHLWFAFRKSASGKEGIPFYWVELSVEKLTWGLGIWGENRSANDILRKKIIAYPDDVAQVLSVAKKQGFALGGNAYKKMPVPTEVSEGLQTLYKQREIYFEKQNVKMQWAFDEKLVNRIAKDFKALKSVYHLLSGCTEEALEILEMDK